MSTILECQHVERHFGPDIRVLTDVTLVVGAGAFIAISGRSGSGKSTLLSIIGLLDDPSAGEVRIVGMPTRLMTPRVKSTTRAQVIGFVFQDFHLLPQKDALGNAALGGAYLGIDRDERYRRAQELLTTLGLQHRLSADISTLSGGERQRVSIARSLVGRPKLVLADEP